MSMLWIAVIAASLASFVQKWLGYQVPSEVLERPRVARVTRLLPIALLGPWSRCRRRRTGPRSWPTPAWRRWVWPPCCWLCAPRSWWW